MYHRSLLTLGSLSSNATSTMLYAFLEVVLDNRRRWEDPGFMSVDAPYM